MLTRRGTFRSVGLVFWVSVGPVFASGWFSVSGQCASGLPIRDACDKQ